MFNKLVTENAPTTKKKDHFLFSWKGFTFLKAKSHYEKTKPFSKLCRNSKFNVLVNFNFILST